MKSKQSTCSTLLPFVLLLVFVACNKADHADSDPEKNADDNTNTFISSTCPNAPNYGDSIIYLQPTSSGHHTVSPINNAGVAGTYLSWPEGLDINKNTGVINVS